MAKKLKKLLKSFTLIELIIVIAIVAVLGTAAFLILTKWLGKSRDASKIANLRNIQTTLDLYTVKSEVLPEPDNAKSTFLSGGLVFTQGEFGEQVVSKLQNISKPPKLGESYYEYSLASDKKTYQIGTKMEDEKYKVGMMNKVYADNGEYYKFEGNYEKTYKVYTGGEEYFMYMPSLFITGYSSEGKNDLNENTNTGFYEDGKKGDINGNREVANMKDQTKLVAILTGNGLVDETESNYQEKINMIINKTPGGKTINSQVNITLPINGECGEANGGSYADINGLNSGGLCKNGVAGTVSGEGPWNWKCSGENGGVESQQCSANKSLVPTSGECGTANTKEYENNISSYGADTQCAVGTSTNTAFPDQGGTATRTCSGVNGGAESVQCSATRKHWCIVQYTNGEYHSGWSVTTQLGFQSNKCYIFGDEDETARTVCNKRVTDNIDSNYGEWIWVPARWFITDGNGTDLKNSFYQRTVVYQEKEYVCRGFAVMKYEAKLRSDQRVEANATRKTRTCSDYATDNDTFCTTLGAGGITSSASNYPIAGIRQGEAINACGIAGTYHLMTNNEWMAVARNIEQQGENWSSNQIGDGYVYVGHTDWGPTQTLQASTNDEDGYFGTNDTATIKDGVYNNYGSEVEQSYKGQKRTLKLSNGKVVWDLSGNVWEHINKTNNPSISNTRLQSGGWDNNNYGLESMCTNGTWAYYGWYGTDANGIQVCNYKHSGQNKENYGPSGNWNAGNGMGRIYTTNTEDRNSLFLRGGAADNSANSGLFSLVLNRTAAAWGGQVGFRCVR